MAKTKNSFTYVVGLEGGAEEGPLSLADLQPLLRDRRVVGSTFIKRSDRVEWTTAADLPELKVQDVVEQREKASAMALATQEMEKELNLRKVRSGVTWFLWIGALSLVNSLLGAVGIGKSYAMGLGSAHLIAALGDYFGSSGIFVSLGANLGLSFAFLVIGALAYHGKLKLVGPAIAIYVADLILCVLFELWLSVGIHAVALIFMTQALLVSYEVRGIELNWRAWVTHGMTALILSGAGLGAFMFLEKSLIPEPAPWASTAPAQWPQMSVANAGEFKGNRKLDAGNAFFIRTKNGNIVAGTARHLLGPAGGVEPAVKLSELDSAMIKWNLNARNSPKSARVAGLHGVDGIYRVLSDWALMKIAPEDAGKLPVEALSPRLTIVEEGETVYLVGAGASGKRQEIHAAKVEEADDGSIEAKLDKPIELVGYSGSPVVDARGNLVGMLTSSRAKADKEGKMPSFVAESVLAVRILLK